MKLLIVFILFSFFAFAQTPQDFGKEMVAKLASPEFYGRGYVNNGCGIAADFIESKFKEYGLKPFNGDYKQEFSFDVNTFPTVVEMQLDGRKLETGKEFIVSPISGSSKGEYTIMKIDSLNFPQIIEDLKSMRLGGSTAFLIDGKGISDKDLLAQFNEFKYYLTSLGPVILVEEEKFTWSVGRQNTKNALVSVLRSNLSKRSSKVSFNIKHKLEQDYKVANIIGFIEGKCKKKTIVISAHYDHLGMMGQNVYFPGANDNASGTSMLLYLAKYYSTHQPKQNIVFMAFAGEEAGILGSKYYTENPLFPLEKIRFLTNLDLAGTGDEGVTVVNATLHKKQFKKLGKINLKNNYLERVKLRGPAANSDHYFFTQKGVPAFFIYTNGGISAYHDVYDKSETLPLTEFNDYSQLLIDFFKKL